MCIKKECFLLHSATSTKSSAGKKADTQCFDFFWIDLLLKKTLED